MNNRTLAVVATENKEEHPSNIESRNTAVPQINEDYITQVSEGIEGRVKKTVSGVH